jgi:hypothetical protein
VEWTSQAYQIVAYNINKLKYTVKLKLENNKINLYHENLTKHINNIGQSYLTYSLLYWRCSSRF